ncbi:hypothetical protein O7614_26855 [Micromonospora sp. WMMD961]|uniref:hypothetical protein n=1 Tax=Micromonospora sp. WMMD961 TaxID=3016100 RepID=UPI002417342C|nr:hypothetical protein [Micromonospora sp. WMMD961]MDG4783283.1 hypothetical protein [Micromonospora sp. WMMD961]
MAKPSAAQKRELLDAISMGGIIRPNVHPRTLAVMEREGWVEERATSGFYKHAMFVTLAGREAVGMLPEGDKPEVTPAGEVIVYRIEDRDGRGPYNNYPMDFKRNKIIRELCKIHASPTTHPAGQLDGITSDNGFTVDHYFGFINKASLARWFTGWGERLTEAGFYVSTFAARSEDILHGRKQIAFAKGRARYLGTSPVADYIA